APVDTRRIQSLENLWGITVRASAPNPANTRAIRGRAHESSRAGTGAIRDFHASTLRDRAAGHGPNPGGPAGLHARLPCGRDPSRAGLPPSSAALRPARATLPASLLRARGELPPSRHASDNALPIPTPPAPAAPATILMRCISFGVSCHSYLSA